MLDTVYGTYLHCRPDGTPFYVGKGTEARMNRDARRNPYHTNIVNKYGASNILKGFMECSTEQTAFDLEKGIIKCLKCMGVRLSNMTEGGEGVSGYKHTNETKQANSLRTTGRAVSQETRAKISASTKGVKKGLQSSEHKEKNRLGHLGKVASEETRQKMSASQLGMKHTVTEVGRVALSTAMSKRNKGNTNTKGKVWCNDGVKNYMLIAHLVPKEFNRGILKCQ